MIAPPLPDHIARRIDVGDCWVWTGRLRPDGYARASVGGRHVYVHRLVYELLVGSIPDGLELDHLCRNPPCCNPAHLEPVTHAENVRRGAGPTARQARQSRCIHGHEFDGHDGHQRTCSQCRGEIRRRWSARRAA